MNLSSKVNVPTELAFESAASYQDIFNEIELDVLFQEPDGREWSVPAFWAGGGTFRARFAAPEPGRYTWRSVCSNLADSGLHGKTGEFAALPYDGDNELYKHGRLRVAANQRNLEHSDGKPFFWMGDTWWMGLTTRLDWPDGFKRLTADRVNKGFNLIQIVAGPLPNFDAETEIWHPYQRNESGWPWEQDWARTNPAYYDLADRRISYLVENGLMPCIVGMWGYYISYMGEDRAKKHWRNLVARYGAYPVVWCVAGEVKLPTYSKLNDAETVERIGEFQSRAWTDVARYVREIDPYANLVTVHPWAELAGRLSVTDDSVLDFDMLQTGHGGVDILKRGIETVIAASARTPRKPVVDGEPCYEGIMGTAWQDQQRFVFWTHMLSGSVGHTYGAQGIWQMSTREDPYSQEWGTGFWPEAMNYPGSAQVPLGKKLFERYDWPGFEPMTLAEGDQQGRISALASGMPGKVWLFYFTPMYLDAIFFGVQGLKISIEPGVRYRAFFYNPRTGDEVDGGMVEPDSDGTWPVPARPTMEDWVLVLEAAP